jgi:hypothetical protein
MNTWISVARYQLTDRNMFVVSPWGILTLDFLIVLFIVASIPRAHGQVAYTGALSSIYVVLIVSGAMNISRQLPFALALGVSRRFFYAGATLLSLVLAAVYGLALTVLQLIERGTGGWGLNMHFFRVNYLLAGPWYLSWLTSFVCLSLVLAWGMWFGIVYPALERRRPAELHRRSSPGADRRTADHQRQGRLAQRRPLLFHADHRRADRPARRPDRGAAGRRVRHRAPSHHMIRVRESRLRVRLGTRYGRSRVRRAEGAGGPCHDGAPGRRAGMPGRPAPRRPAPVTSSSSGSVERPGGRAPCRGRTRLGALGRRGDPPRRR